jgi:hypothetical protein
MNGLLEFGVKAQLDVHLIWSKKHDYVGHYKFSFEMCRQKVVGGSSTLPFVANNDDWSVKI